MRSLLRGGQTAQAVARLEEVQRLAPNLPHTCFNLGIYYKKAGEVQSESMPEVSSADLSRVGATFDEELPMGPASFYDYLRTGCKEHHAGIRALAFKWQRILFRCWKDQVRYEDSTYLAALKKLNSPLLAWLPA